MVVLLCRRTNGGAQTVYLRARHATLFHHRRGLVDQTKVSTAVASWSSEPIAALKPGNDVGRVLLRCVFPDEMPTLEKDVTAAREVVRQKLFVWRPDSALTARLTDSADVSRCTYRILAKYFALRLAARDGVGRFAQGGGRAAPPMKLRRAANADSSARHAAGVREPQPESNSDG